MFVLDWLFGDHSQQYDPPRWLDRLESEIDQAPILRLNRAIVQQAISDEAARIDFWVGIPELEDYRIETPKEYARRCEEEDPNSEVYKEKAERAKSRAEFKRVMAKAGILDEQPIFVEEEMLKAFFTFGGFPRVAIAIPPDLVAPIVRAYPYYFNFETCATIERPENLLYVSTKERAAFASIDHYDRRGNHKLGICLEYEDIEP